MCDARRTAGGTTRPLLPSHRCPAGGWGSSDSVTTATPSTYWQSHIKWHLNGEKKGSVVAAVEVKSLHTPGERKTTARTLFSAKRLSYACVDVGILGKESWQFRWPKLHFGSFARVFIFTQYCHCHCFQNSSKSHLPCYICFLDSFNFYYIVIVKFLAPKEPFEVFFHIF